MAIEVYPHLNPRLIRVVGVTEITVQNLVNQTRDWEDNVENTRYPKLLSAVGKDDLGGGVYVGITARLENTTLSFEEQTTSVESGVCSIFNSSGTILTDSSATFVTSGVASGSTIVNFTDRSVCTVLNIDSETQITHTVLKDGINNQWAVSDTYKIWNEIQCSISGGNLVAVDENGDPISSVTPSAFTQIVKTSSSSATLQELSAIQHSVFSNMITVDVVNGVAGTAFPIGTGESPVNNIADAKTIAISRGIKTFYIIGNITLSSGVSVSNYSFEGESQSKSIITINTVANVLNCEFYEATIEGTLDGNCVLRDCKILDLDYIEGEMHDCLLVGTITLMGDAHIINCWSGVLGVGTPIIDLGGSGNGLGLRNYNGGIKFINKTGVDNISIDLNSGKVILDSTIINGTIVVRGTGELEDNSIGDALVISHYLTNPFNIRKNILPIIEGLRSHHIGTGNVYYWNPITGDDTKDGISVQTAVLTFTKAHDLVTNNNHDIIYLIPEGNPSYNSSTPITITKNWVMVRGPGFDFRLKPTSLTINGAGIEIQAKGVQLQGFHLDMSAAGSNATGIYADGEYIHIEGVICKNASSHGMVFKNGHENIIVNNFVGYCGGDGIKIMDNCEDTVISGGHIDECGGNGVHIVGTDIHEIMLKDKLLIHESGEYGLKIETGVEKTHIYSDVIFRDNILEEISNSGIDTMDERIINNQKIARDVWDVSVNQSTVSGSFGEYVKNKMLTISKFLGLK